MALTGLMGRCGHSWRAEQRCQRKQEASSPMVTHEEVWSVVGAHGGGGRGGGGVVL